MRIYNTCSVVCAVRCAMHHVFPSCVNGSLARPVRLASRVFGKAYRIVMHIMASHNMRHIPIDCNTITNVCISVRQRNGHDVHVLTLGVGGAQHGSNLRSSWMRLVTRKLSGCALPSQDHDTLYCYFTHIANTWLVSTWLGLLTISAGSLYISHSMNQRRLSESRSFVNSNVRHTASSYDNDGMFLGVSSDHIFTSSSRTRTCTATTCIVAVRVANVALTKARKHMSEIYNLSIP